MTKCNAHDVILLEINRKGSYFGFRCFGLRLRNWPVRVALFRTGQEDGGQTGWTGQTGQQWSVIWRLINCFKAFNMGSLQFWNLNWTIDTLQNKNLEPCTNGFLDWEEVRATPNADAVREAVVWSMTQTGWTGQDFWPGYVSWPIRPVLHSQA